MSELSAVDCDATAFHLVWADGSRAECPHIWLRDNDPGELHPHTRERLFDLKSVSLDIRPESWQLGPSQLVVKWPEKSSDSHYPLDWLLAHRPGERRSDPARVDRSYWSAEDLRDIPRFDAMSCRQSAPVLMDALQTAKRLGLVIFDALQDNEKAGESLGELIGFMRRTNFGTTFEVVNKPSPNNLAYTALPLPLHTDLPNQEQVPGYQFLHCLRNSVRGGGSTFADGFQICSDLRAQLPEEFDLLSRLKIPWRFHDANDDVRYRRSIIDLDSAGELSALSFNAHIADVPDLPSAQLRDFYQAYQNLMLRISDPQYQISHALQPGEMVMFDNRRVLHGREGFDPASGERHLRGFYVEHNEVDSRIRTLAAG
jgi:Taurine catabolism dioxygenase TauD, TfdA family/Gamma-butyrobetaine hydroxylase-like, N-terminal